MENLDSKFWLEWRRVNAELRIAKSLHLEWLYDYHAAVLGVAMDEGAGPVELPLCGFGAFVDKNLEETLRHNDTFRHVLEWHDLMHERAEVLLRAVESKNDFSEQDYGAFKSIGLMFQNELDFLLFDLEHYSGGIDQLTGLMNRKAMEDILPREQERARRHGTDCCIAIVDADHFKTVNDTFGHGTGDELLIALVDLLRGNIRSYDWLFRLGGEEFLICMPDTPIEAAERVLNRVCAHIRETDFDLRTAQNVGMTVSIGAAPMLENEDLAGCLRAADAQLYVAKEQGRDRVCCAESAAKKRAAGESES